MTMFVFKDARTVSGNNTDALAAIQSCCLPLDHEKGGERTKALSASTRTEFKRRGFDTISFSSRALVSRIKSMMDSHCIWFAFSLRPWKALNGSWSRHNSLKPLIGSCTQRLRKNLINPPTQDDWELNRLIEPWKSFYTRFSVKRAVHNIILAY